MTVPTETEDLISITEAARLLGYRGSKPVSGVLRLIERGQLAEYPVPADAEPRRGWYPGRRFVSRREVEALRQRRIAEARDRLARLQRLPQN